MDPAFWHERWALGETGFHRTHPHWALQEYWPVLTQDPTQSVLVPLCGKSVDLHWLAARQAEVTGVELDPSALEAFLREWPTNTPPICTWETLPRGHRRTCVDGLTLIAGDFFSFQTDAPFDTFYDRAALIALPLEMRQTYLSHLHALLAPGACGLVVTFEYEQIQMDGPPFSVNNEEVQRAPGWSVEPLTRRDVLADHPGMQAKGLTALTECVYRFERLE